MHPFLLGIGFIIGVLASPKVRRTVQTVRPNFRGVFPRRNEAEAGTEVPASPKQAKKRKTVSSKDAAL